MMQEPLWGGCSQIIPQDINYTYLVPFESPVGNLADVHSQALRCFTCFHLALTKPMRQVTLLVPF